MASAAAVDQYRDASSRMAMHARSPSLKLPSASRRAGVLAWSYKKPTSWQPWWSVPRLYRQRSSRLFSPGKSPKCPVLDAQRSHVWGTNRPYSAWCLLPIRIFAVRARALRALTPRSPSNPESKLPRDKSYCNIFIFFKFLSYFFPSHTCPQPSPRPCRSRTLPFLNFSGLYSFTRS